MFRHPNRSLAAVYKASASFGNMSSDEDAPFAPSPTHGVESLVTTDSTSNNSFHKLVSLCLHISHISYAHSAHQKLLHSILLLILEKFIQFSLHMNTDCFVICPHLGELSSGLSTFLWCLAAQLLFRKQLDTVIPCSF